jgi:hypothetical protein
VSKEEEEFYQRLVGEEAPKAPAPDTVGDPIPPEPPSLKAVTSKNLFSHPDVHPVVLDLALISHFQLAWFSWLPETLFREIELSFKTSIAEVNRLKILAVQNLHVTDMFWETWEVFEKTLAALNGVIPRLDVMQPPDLSALLAGIDTANAIRTEEFSDQVGRYVAACILNEQVSYAPPPIDFAQPFVSQPYYICKDCEKKGSALPPTFDGHCDSCVHKFDQEHNLSLKPDQEMIAKGFGKNITVHLTYDPQPTKKRFEELDRLPTPKLGSAIQETATDVEAAKLIIATDFQKFRTQQLQEQLTALGPWLGASA